MAARKPSCRSSLFSHSFPSFYACYLLKSIQTPLSTANYIGSTPNPPKRIRQHNGELTQGAKKTRTRRPWVMQMIVYGFPSKLAALQFEWAWQHPHLSRHLRGADGTALLKRSKAMKSNIRIVKVMIATPPWNKWPLHVKLFTDEAVRGWTAITKEKDQSLLPLPTGFTVSQELEGVDGKSGKRGSGRTGPISVKDEQFTAAYLAKNTSLLSTNTPLNCSICQHPIPDYAATPLTTTLCSHPACKAVSHLKCLSRAFLAHDTGMIPRGGTCASCRTYVLWGDVIKGSFRRAAGGLTPELDDEEVPELYASEELELELGPEHSQAAGSPAKGKAKAKPAPTKPRKKSRPPQSSEGELFDFDVSSSDESAPPPSPRKRGRPRGVSPAGVPDSEPQDSEADTRKRGRPRKVVDSTAVINIPSSSKAPRKPGRPAPLLTTQTNLVAGKGKRKAKAKAGTTRKYHTIATANPNHKHIPSDDSGEFFDFGGVSEYESDDGGGPKRLGEGGGSMNAAAVWSPLGHGPPPPKSPEVTNERWFDIDSPRRSPSPLVDWEVESGGLRTYGAHVDDDGQLSRAMSVLSVSSSSAFAGEITIEVSD